MMSFNAIVSIIEIDAIIATLQRMGLVTESPIKQGPGHTLEKNRRSVGILKSRLMQWIDKAKNSLQTEGAEGVSDLSAVDRIESAVALLGVGR